jgi:cysteine desulfurase
MWLSGKSAEEVVIALGMAGAAVSYGSACSARAFKPSRIIKAMGYSDARASESIRLSFGRETVMTDAKALITGFKNLKI